MTTKDEETIPSNHLRLLRCIAQLSGSFRDQNKLRCACRTEEVNFLVTDQTFSWCEIFSEYQAAVDRADGLQGVVMFRLTRRALQRAWIDAAATGHMEEMP